MIRKGPLNCPITALGYLSDNREFHCPDCIFQPIFPKFNTEPPFIIPYILAHYIFTRVSITVARWHFSCNLLLLFTFTQLHPLTSLQLHSHTHTPNYRHLSNTIQHRQQLVDRLHSQQKVTKTLKLTFQFITSGPEAIRATELK